MDNVFSQPQASCKIIIYREKHALTLGDLDFLKACGVEWTMRQDDHPHPDIVSRKK